MDPAFSYVNIGFCDVLMYVELQMKIWILRFVTALIIGLMHPSNYWIFGFLNP